MPALARTLSELTLPDTKKIIWVATDREEEFLFAETSLREVHWPGRVLPAGEYVNSEGQTINLSCDYMIDDRGVIYAKAKRPIAVGSFGEVTLLETVDGHRYVLKKELGSHFMSSVQEGDQEFEIARVMGVGVTKFAVQLNALERQQYTILEYLGLDLCSYLRQREGMSPVARLELAIKIADALFEMHRKGYVHFDIKPENILIDRRRNVHFADFGLSKPLEDRVTDWSGTANYFLPLSLERNPKAAFFDIFAFFRTLHMPQQFEGLGGSTSRLPERESFNILTDDMLVLLPELKRFSMVTYGDFDEWVRPERSPDAVIQLAKERLVAARARLLDIQKTCFQEAVLSISRVLQTVTTKTSDPVKVQATTWYTGKLVGLSKRVELEEYTEAMLRELLALVDSAKKVFAHHNADKKSGLDIFNRFYRTDALTAFEGVVNPLCAKLSRFVSSFGAESEALSSFDYGYFSSEVSRFRSGVCLPRARFDTLVA